MLVMTHLSHAKEMSEGDSAPAFHYGHLVLSSMPYPQEPCARKDEILHSHATTGWVLLSLICSMRLRQCAAPCVRTACCCNDSDAFEMSVVYRVSSVHGVKLSGECSIGKGAAYHACAEAWRVGILHNAQSDYQSELTLLKAYRCSCARGHRFGDLPQRQLHCCI